MRYGRVSGILVRANDLLLYMDYHPLHGGPPVQPYSGIPGCVVEWFLSSVYLNSNHRLYEQGCAEAKLPPPYPLSLITDKRKFL